MSLIHDYLVAAAVILELNSMKSSSSSSSSSGVKMAGGSGLFPGTGTGTGPLASDNLALLALGSLDASGKSSVGSHADNMAITKATDRSYEDDDIYDALPHALRKPINTVDNNQGQGKSSRTTTETSSTTTTTTATATVALSRKLDPLNENI